MRNEAFSVVVLKPDWLINILSSTTPESMVERCDYRTERPSMHFLINKRAPREHEVPAMRKVNEPLHLERINTLSFLPPLVEEVVGDSLSRV
jgi:hypothetical protein